MLILMRLGGGAVRSMQIDISELRYRVNCPERENITMRMKMEEADERKKVESTDAVCSSSVSTNDKYSESKGEESMQQELLVLQQNAVPITREMNIYDAIDNTPLLLYKNGCVDY